MKRKIAFILACTLAACGGKGGGNGDLPDANNPGSDGGSGSDGSVDNSKRTVFTIVLENHDFKEIVGSANAPYINSLIAMGGLATNYKDTIHPSLGNYLNMISGANQYPGFIDVDPTSIGFPVDQPHLGTQLEAAGIKWRAYQESMGTPCRLTSNGPYAPKHNPFVYFKDFQTNPICADRDVDYSNFAADLATNNFRFMWITPNLNSDGHDPSGDPVTALKNSDHWMSTEVPKILASDGFKNGGVLFVTWDEAEGRNGDDTDLIPMIVLSPRLKQPGMTSATAMTHGSYTATIEELFGFQKLATVAGKATLMEFLNP